VSLLKTDEGSTGARLEAAIGKGIRDALFVDGSARQTNSNSHCTTITARIAHPKAVIDRHAGILLPKKSAAGSPVSLYAKSATPF
jgi:hypothetical protein